MQRRAIGVNQGRAFSLAEALISADDVSKEVKGDNSEATTAALPYSPRSDLCFSLFIFLRRSRSFSYHIFDIINIDRAVHLEPLFNNWLPWPDVGINGECLRIEWKR